MRPEGIFQFGAFQIDIEARTVRREEEAVALNRRAFDVLLYFIQNPGRILTRDELLKNVWSDSFVDENSLAQSACQERRFDRPAEAFYAIRWRDGKVGAAAPAPAAIVDSLGAFRTHGVTYSSAIQ